MDVDLGHLSQPCACGMEHEVQVEMICIEPGAVERLEDILGPYQNPVFICDSNTRAAAEPYLEEEFKDHLVIELDPEGLLADEAGIQKVLSQLEVCDIGLSSVSVDALVAIGGGTIHDLTRYAADEYQIPFVSIPTAASVDGYTSSVAMYRKDGMSRYIHASSPRWVLADTNIFSNAPYSLTASGISEIYGKYTALLDWKVAHMVCGEHFCQRVYRMISNALGEIDRIVDDILDNDPEGYERLMYHLLMIGLTVEMLGSTRAVSGAEHYIARLWGMYAINQPAHSYHGQRVGVGALLLLSYYKKMAEDIENGRIHASDESARGMEMDLLESVFGDSEKLDALIEENTPNPLEAVDLEALDEMLPAIAEMIGNLPSVKKIKDRMKKAGCVTELSEIGIPEEQKALTLRLAPYVRNRQTLLRLSKLFE